VATNIAQKNAKIPKRHFLPVFLQTLIADYGDSVNSGWSKNCPAKGIA